MTKLFKPRCRAVPRAALTLLLLCGSASRVFGANASAWNYDMQVGLDAWDLRPSVDKDTQKNQNGNTRLFLANSAPYFPYESPAPWINFQGSVRVWDNTKIGVRYRRDTSSGSRLDELSLDQSIHRFGVRAGVLDYKTSWCRTYDLDSPWVRENDPFCTVRTTSQSIRAAPGVQFYTRGDVGDLQVQAVAGVYNPLKFDYAPDEFTNTVMTAYSKVVQNDKVGLSVNVTNVATALDLRLSLLHTDQAANYRAIATDPSYRIDQTVDVVFAGISFNPVPPLTVRLTKLSSSSRYKAYYPSGWVRPGDDAAEVVLRSDSPKESSVLELNYQAGARDVYSFAYSVYDLSSDATGYGYDPVSKQTIAFPSSDVFGFRNTSTSISWRRDWKKGIFTVLQWTTSQAQSAKRTYVSPNALSDSNGTALGLRLGYRF